MKGSSSILFLILLIVVFYVLILLPQRRQQKNRAEMLKKLGPGARIMTAAGLYGEIVAMQGDIAIVRIADGVDVEMDQRAIVRVLEEGRELDHEEPVEEDEAEERDHEGRDEHGEVPDEASDEVSEAEREFDEHRKEHGGT
ncbi:preprotein translocase subunit YajC [Alicyclobacillus sendaiensis]|uniref:Preprotein translocase subunit YajC n=1 Tax=Alicyclobacillus sendaiensis PA2 TaxID=3029425 RepID=A0ABT6XZN5_ALISE|nr:preprotein translocase subunit YajC [Alicyclobacillus sendaiensis]MDI9260546.1 preprotein translocase subunit YajC [Alicyclobacillus sendaiensis PA2]